MSNADLERCNDLIALEIPDSETDGYSKGFRDALESIALYLILAKTRPSLVMEGLQTALDAYGNNIDLDDDVDPNSDEAKVLILREKVMEWWQGIVWSGDVENENELKLANKAAYDTLGVSIGLSFANIDAKFGCKIPTDQYTADEIVEEINNCFEYLKKITVENEIPARARLSR